MRYILTGLAAVALSSPAVSQDFVGSSVVNGRAVQLMSDFTWKYITAAPINCQAVQDNISFCGQKAGWTQTGSANEEGVLFRLNDRVYGKIIVEKVGSDDGFTDDSFRAMIIQNAASAAKVQPKDIVTSDLQPASLDGVSGSTITYFAKLQGTPFVYINTVLLDKHRAVQIVTFGLGTALTDELKIDHKTFLDSMHLK